MAEEGFIAMMITSYLPSGRSIGFCRSRTIKSRRLGFGQLGPTISVPGQFGPGTNGYRTFRSRSIHTYVT